MRKRLIADNRPDAAPETGAWLDLEKLASVEVTSENPDFPIESAFSADKPGGWRAAAPGEQVIRLLFDQPQGVRRIQLRFESETERTQEFVLEWAPVGGSFKGIVRQQWNFSPESTTTEVEDYHVDLTGVSVLQLTIKPDITYGKAVASLSQWRVG